MRPCPRRLPNRFPRRAASGNAGEDHKSRGAVRVGRIFQLSGRGWRPDGSERRTRSSPGTGQAGNAVMDVGAVRRPTRCQRGAVEGGVPSRCVAAPAPGARSDGGTAIGSVTACVAALPGAVVPASGGRPLATGGGDDLASSDARAATLTDRMSAGTINSEGILGRRMSTIRFVGTSRSNGARPAVVPDRDPFPTRTSAHRAGGGASSQTRAGVLPVRMNGSLLAGSSRPGRLRRRGGATENAVPVGAFSRGQAAGWELSCHR